MMRFEPLRPDGPAPRVDLIDSLMEDFVSEADYFTRLREVYNTRNPHAIVEGLGE
ncbi:MAG: hypothetical protein ACRD9L_11895 [Bryobacteraceae bacterium]